MPSNRNILLLVEGSKTEPALMQKLLQMYNICDEYGIVSYYTNIYSLYDVMFRDDTPDDYDIVLHLKEKAETEAQRQLLDRRFTDIILIFDLDPQDKRFSFEKIGKMLSFFTESSDMGKLYINYPMIESFYHMKCIPDPDYNSYYASLIELQERTYKRRVHDITYKGDYSKFATTIPSCNAVIRANLDKAYYLMGLECSPAYEIPDDLSILDAQEREFAINARFGVLCTCIFFIPYFDIRLITEYNPQER